MLKIFNCNLHVHTCLSPCADFDMHPSALVREAIQCGLDVIAISDHNASENVKYVMAAAIGTPLVVLPAMEITTREEAHVLAWFDTIESLRALQETIYDHLEGLNDEDIFGCQVVVNEHGEVEGFNEKLLIGATNITLEDVVRRIHELGGLAAAAHIDRESFSVLGQLGFIPDTVALDALEISSRMSIAGARKTYPELARYTFVTSSDAHYLRDIGGVSTKIRMQEPTVAELKMAFMKQDGRKVFE